MPWSHREWSLAASAIVALESIVLYFLLQDARVVVFLLGAAAAAHGAYHRQEGVQWAGLALLGLGTAFTFASLGTLFLPLVLGLAVLMGLQRAEKSEGKLEPPEGVR